GGHAELVLELLLELGQLEDGHLLERLEQLVCGHGCHRCRVSLVNGYGAGMSELGLAGCQAAAACLASRAATSPTMSRSGASNRPAVVAIGAANAPAICDRSVSRFGSDARRVTALASIARSPSRAPVIFTWRYGRIVSMTAFAVAPSSFPKAIAVGPLSSGSSAEPTVSAAAIFISRFLITRYVTSCLRRERRISWISRTVRPRYSETISVRFACSC